MKRRTEGQYFPARLELARLVSSLLYVTSACLFSVKTHFGHLNSKGFLRVFLMTRATMTGRKNRALQVPLVVPYKALEKLPKALYGTTGGTCSARLFRPVMIEIFILQENHFIDLQLKF